MGNQMEKPHDSGLQLPTVESRSSTSFRASTGNIAAIDFGTTSCSLSYCLKGNDKIRFLKLDDTHDRVPTAILMDNLGNISEFGFNARKKYANLKAEAKLQHYYFQHLKMNLQHERNGIYISVTLNDTTDCLAHFKCPDTDQSIVHLRDGHIKLYTDQKIGWKYTIKPLGVNKEFYLVEVIAMILKYLKNHLITVDLDKSMKGVIKASDFDWVITVPAMWKARGRHMMREAAYMAGIASDMEIRSFTEVVPGRHPTTYVKHATPSILSLALEPEAAAIYCKKEMSPTITSQCYLVLDIGGGTVDISVHAVNALNGIDVILPARGNAWGGTTVNTEFKTFLGDLVNDSTFNSYLSAGPEEQNVKRSAELDYIVNDLFENQKRFFGRKGVCEEEAIINLPFNFMKVYEEALKQGIGEIRGNHVSLNDNDLVISYAKMAEFFARPLAEIKACVLHSLKETEDKGCIVDTILFVGGFGGCKYVYSELENEIEKSYKKKRIHCFRPEDHETAVASGAVLFRRNPTIVESRRIDATYGTSCSSKFISGFHDKAYRFYDDDNQPYCRHVFVPFVKKGDTVNANQLLVRTYTPIHHNQKSMSVNIYTSSKDNVLYVRTADGKPVDDVIEIGELTVQMPIPRGDKERQVKITFDFTHTEIQIQAYDVTSGKTCYTVVDFLTEMD